MKRAHKVLIATLLFGALAGCGGGGGGSSTSSAQPVSGNDSVPQSVDVVTNQGARESTALMPVAVAVQKPAALARLEDAANSMMMTNEVIPFGVRDIHPWKFRPTVTLGVTPLGSNLPNWWPGIRLEEWRGFIPWFVVFETGQGNQSSNTLVEVSGIEAWVLRESTKRWELVVSGDAPKWFNLYIGDSVTTQSHARSPGRVREGVAELDAGGGYAVHGGLQIVPTPWVPNGAPDILAIYVSLNHRLVLRDQAGADDRDLASLGVQVGADYWPCERRCDVDIQSPYYPASGTGRIVKSRKEHTRATLFVAKAGVDWQVIAEFGLPEFRY